jgi:nitrate reductase assembly molybdenum cofactor insertion protein NarJ
MLTLKVLAALLVYPEQELIDALDEMAAILLPKAPCRSPSGGRSRR